MSLGILWERFCDGFKAVTEIHRVEPKKAASFENMCGENVCPLTDSYSPYF